MSFPNQVLVQIFEPSTPFGGVQVREDGQPTVQIALDSGSPVQSVFGRVGDILPQCSDYALCYAPLGTGLPPGGGAGQVLTKNTASDFDAGWSAAGSGSVSNFSAGTLSPLFTTSVANPTTTPALSFALSNAGAHQFLGNNTGAPGAPAYVQPSFSDLSGQFALNQTPSTTASVLIGRGAGAGAGIFQEITLGTNLSMSGTTLNATGGGGAPTDAHYLTDRAESGLSAEVNLGALSTGLVKATVSAGVATISTIADSSANWDSAFSERRQWDGGSTNLVAATGRTSLGATTLGGNLFTAANPGAITFLKVNADNSVTFESAATHRTSLGVAASGAVGSSGLTMNTARLLGRTTAAVGAIEEISVGSTLSLAATTLGIATNGVADANIRQSAALSIIGRSANSTGNVADISATAASGAVLRESGSTIGWGTIASAGIGASQVTYAKIQNVAANAVLCNPTASPAAPSEVALAASQLLGRGSSGNIAAISPTSPVQIGASSISLNVGVDFLFSAGQSITLTSSVTSSILYPLTLTHNSSLTPLAGFGMGIQFLAKDSTTNGQEQGEINTVWSDPAHASRTAYMDFMLMNNTALGSKMRLFPSGGLSVNSTTDPGAGYINANTGFKVGGSQIAISNLANLSAVSRLVGSGSGGAGVVEITLGSGLTMTGTTLSVSAGGGNVSNSGTPTSGQVAIWQTASTIAGVTPTAPIAATSSTLSLNMALDFGFTALQTITGSDSGTNNDFQVLKLRHLTSGTPAADFATGIQFSLDANGGTNQQAAELKVGWGDPALATRSAYMDFQLANNGVAPASKMKLFPSGGLSVNSTTDPGAGQINANSGLKIANAALNFSHLAGDFALTQTPSASADRLIGRGNGGGAGDWQEISLGSGLSMSGTTLNVTAGGGNVSNVGTPANDQVAVWTGTNNIEGTAALTQSAAGMLSITYSDGGTNNQATVLNLFHATSGTATTGFGLGLAMNAENAAGTLIAQGLLETAWSNAGAGTESSYMLFMLKDAGGDTEPMRLYGNGGLSVGSTVDPGAGTVNANNGFKVANAALNFSHLAGTFSLAQTPSMAAAAIIGRRSGSSGTWEEITLGTNLSMSGTTLNAAGGSGTPGGSDTQVQFNDGGTTFGGDAGLTYNKTTDALSIAGNINVGPAPSAALLAIAPSSTIYGVTTTSGAAAAGFESTQASSTTSGSSFHLYENDGAAMASGDRLGGVIFGGSSSASAIRNTASIFGFASENWTDGASYGTRLRFDTCNSGATARTEKFAIESSGLVTFGGATSSFPALKRNSAALEVRLADDSASADLTVNNLTINGTGTVNTAGTATKSIVSIDGTQTLTNKRINPRVDDQNAPSSPYAPNSDNFDMAVLRGITAALTINAPTGTPVQGQKLVLRFKDNGTARGLTFQTGSAGQFRFSSDMAAPSTTIVNMTLYMLFMYNSTDSRWDNLAQMNNF